MSEIILSNPQKIKNLFSLLALSSLAIILVGCAASYRPINPSSVNYTNHDFDEGVGISYRYDVLRESGNKKYAKKEDKKNIRVIAVKVTNNTDSVITIGKDFLFYSGDNQVISLQPVAIKSNIKQIVPGYLPYLIFTFLKLYITSGTSTQTYSIGYILGPALTIGNMAMAGSANSNMLKELNTYNLINREIQKNETVYGVIGIRDNGYNPISLKRKQ